MNNYDKKIKVINICTGGVARTIKAQYYKNSLANSPTVCNFAGGGGLVTKIVLWK